jgi:hypothetical protein
MIKVTPFNEATATYQEWFKRLDEEGLTPEQAFDPYNAFHYYTYADLESVGLDIGQHEQEYPYTISGSTVGVNPDGSYVTSLTILVGGEEQSVSNVDLRWILGPSFPDIEMDPESDQFFAYAKTEEDAQLLVRLLNQPDQFGALIEEVLNS